MKKLFLIVLSLSMLLSGCTHEEVIVKIPVDAKKPVVKEIESEKPEVDKEDSVIIVEKDIEVFKYSKDDKIVESLEKLGHNPSNGYTFYPIDNFIYPEYINVDGEFKNVYLSIEDAVKFIEYHENEYFTSINTSGPLNVMGLAAADAVPSFNLDGMFKQEIGISEDIEIINNLNTSEYKDVKESGFLNTRNNPLSTFAADVDTASYTNLRKIIKEQLLINDDYGYSSLNEELHDVRIEEMLNYFDYNSYKTSDEKFTVSAEISDTPWNKDTQLLVVNVKAKELDVSQKTGSNLVFLVDTSGSMDNPDKLPLLKKSLELLVNELTENDKISIVTYSGDSRVVLEGVNGNEKETILKAIQELNPYGSTNGEGGIKKAYKIAGKYKNDYSNSRIIMCSDGDLNVGISSESELVKLIENKRETGIYLSVLGFGLGNYKDNKMEALANNGNGNYHYIDNLAEGKKVLVDEMMSTLVTLGDDVKFQLEFNPEYIKGYRKIGYENRDLNDEDFNDDTKDGGEVGYGHEVTVVYEIVPIDSSIDIPGSDLKYQDTVSIGSDEWLTVNIRYKDHGESVSNLLEFVVDESFYTETPSDDWRFISDVVGFGLIANDSPYKNDLTIEEVVESLKSIDLDDDYKIEFLSLVMGYNYLNNMVE